MILPAILSEVSWSACELKNELDFSWNAMFLFIMGAGVLHVEGGGGGGGEGGGGCVGGEGGVG